MAMIVTALGMLIVLIGAVGLVDPRRLIALVRHWHGPTRFMLAVGVRLGLGVLLLVVAPDCRLPVVIQAVGGVSIVAAGVLLVVGRSRLDTFIEWWLGRPELLCVSGATAVALGALLVYAGPPL